MSWLNLTRTTAAPKTTGRRLTTLKQFAKWTGREVLADYSPPTPGPSAPHPIPEGPEGVDRMIRAATNSRQKALVALCGFAGLRVAEALSIRTSDFDLQDMTVSVRGKGDKTRTVPVSNRCWSGIAAAFVVAQSEREQRLVAYQDRAARQIITTLGKRAGLTRRVTSHDLRATFATAVYDATLDIRVTQQLLGHESVETTQLYTGISQEKMQKAVDF